MSAGWREIAHKSIYFRSKWESNYAKYLEYQKINSWIKDWEHEPKTFWFEQIKRGVRSYLPDFRVLKPDGTHYWVEVKGYMDSRSKTKIKRFKKYFPDEHLELVTHSWFSKNNKNMKAIILDWE